MAEPCNSLSSEQPRGFGVVQVTAEKLGLAARGLDLSYYLLPTLRVPA
ncbi:hypothetical protein BZL30_7592 [Mycobacterium kansasii]|uniref:Uncharacterized protein n=1 Tax=Mycobacterium kansasii TaxID=1768 RepID=A0A1V3WL68_MYCKA|nr:hypothetical protein BZL30_7592 [Mycobacterium kansasii]